MHFHLPSLFKPQLFILYIQFLANAKEEQQSPQLGYECETGKKSRNLTDHWKFHAVRTDLRETIQKLAILTNSYDWTSPGRPVEGCPYSMHALFPKIVEPPTCAERKTNRQCLSIHVFFLVKPRFVPRCSRDLHAFAEIRGASGIPSAFNISICQGVTASIFLSCRQTRPLDLPSDG